MMRAVGEDFSAWASWRDSCWYPMYTRRCIPHCGQTKIEARSQALTSRCHEVDREHDSLCILYGKNGKT